MFSTVTFLRQSWPGYSTKHVRPSRLLAHWACGLMSVLSLQCLIGVCRTGRSRFVQRASERLPFGFGFVYPRKSNSCPRGLSPKCPRVWFSCPVWLVLGKPSWQHELQPHANTCSSDPRRPLQGRTKKPGFPKNGSSLRPLHLCSS